MTGFFSHAGASSASSDRGFATFVRSLPQSPPDQRRVRVFARDGGAFFTTHGDEAVRVAKEYYKTETVVREVAGLPWLSMTHKMFLQNVLPGLLSSGAVVELWEQQGAGGGGREPWVLARTGSPGNTTAFEDMMLRVGGADPHQLLGSGVMMAVDVRGALGKALTLGVAYVNSTFHTMGLCEFEDTADLKNLEAVTVQVGARECLMPQEKEGEEYLLAGAKDVMARCGVLCSLKPREAFKAGGGVTDQLRSLVEGEAAGGQMSSRPWESESGVLLEQASGLKQGLGCLSVLLSHLGLLDDADSRGSFNLSILQLSDHLHYDASAAKALSVFPEARGEVYRPSVQQPGEAPAGPSDPAMEGEGGRKAQLSLFGLLNRTRTPGGARCLKRWLLQPLVREADILGRQAIVALLVDKRGLATSLAADYGRSSRGEASFARGSLDLERTAQRFLSSKAKSRATLQDLLDTYTATLTLDKLSKTLRQHLRQEGAEGQEGEAALEEKLAKPLEKVVQAFAKYQALVEEVVDIDRIVATHGRQVTVKPAFDQELSRLRAELDEARGKMEGVATRLAKAIKVDASRIKLENSAVYGYHLRVTKKDQALLKKQPQSSWQTLAVQKTGLLFTTPELKRLSTAWESSSKAYEACQDAIVSQAVEVARTYIGPMQEGGRLLSELDALLALAQVAATLNWTRPRLAASSGAEAAVVHAKALRHPVVEAALGSAASFIPNDVSLHGLAIITGPNCGGKSTYIRSVGLAVLLAQVGSFVPAEDFEWSPVDRILARVGSSDSQVRGVSTFFAEMLETRAILDTATCRSLVIIDELGRGTSTADGFGIAWSVASRLACSVGSRTLFATHFHELTELEARLPGRVCNYHTTAELTGERLTLLYQIQKGPSDRSFGVNAARLARFPAEVVVEAQARVEELQERAHRLLPLQHQADDGEEEEEEATGGGGKKRTHDDAASSSATAAAKKRRKKEPTAAERSRRQLLQGLVALELEDLPLDGAIDAFTALLSRHVAHAAPDAQQGEA